MTKTVTINGKTYNLPEFNFKDMCDLEDLGFDLQQFAHKPMKHALIFCAFTMKTSEEVAAKEIQDHIKGGGSLDDVFNDIAGAIQNSDFFRSALPAAEKKAGTQKASKGGTEKK